MKKITTCIFIPFISFALSAQNMCEIKLQKNDSQVISQITPRLNQLNGKNEIDFSSGGSIIINFAFPKNNVKILVKNQSGNSDSIFSFTKDFLQNETFKLNFNNLKVCTTSGSSNKPIKGNFRVVIDTVSVPFILKKDSFETSLQNNTVNYQPTGIPLFDAIALKNFSSDSSNKAKVLKILSFYTKEENDKYSFISLNIAHTYFKDSSKNKYLQGFIKNLPYYNVIGIQGTGTLPISSMLSSTLSSVGGLDITNIADGFAKFIIKRTKQELSIAFFEKLDTALSRYKDLQTVFPQTYRTLTTIGEEIYNYNAYIQTLRESFEKDLASLPSNLPSIIDNHEKFFENLPELKAILQTGFYIAQQIQNKEHPGNIIENYPIDDFLSDSNLNPNVKAAFQTLKLLSTSLKSDTSTDSYWASYTDIKKLFNPNDLGLLKIYLGLLEQQAKFNNIVFKNNLGTFDTLANIIDSSYGAITNLTKYQAYIKNFASKVNTIETKIRNLKTVSSDSLKFEAYYSFISDCFDLFRYLTKIQTLPHFPKELNLEANTAKYFYIAQTSVDIVVDINRRNYSAAIVNATSIYDSVFSVFNNNRFRELNTSNIHGEDSLNLIKEQQNQNKTRDVVSSIFKYGSFMAAMVQAKSSDDVESVIEVFALPAGSSRIKRETPFNVSVNAYCGLYGGYEKIVGLDKGSWELNAGGVTAPIGIAFSWGHKKFLWLGKENQNHWSYSAFISLVDIGALAAFRFTNDSTKLTNGNSTDTATASSSPTIQLKNIFSPGLFLSIGIPKSPLSVNLGVQIGPNLRSVSVTNNNANINFNNKMYWRYSVSLCVDLPLLNLYTKSK